MPVPDRPLRRPPSGASLPPPHPDVPGDWADAGWRPAGFGVRFAASCIDSVALAVPIAAVAGLIEPLLGSAPATSLSAQSAGTDGFSAPALPGGEANAGTDELLRAAESIARLSGADLVARAASGRPDDWIAALSGGVGGQEAALRLFDQAFSREMVACNGAELLAAALITIAAWRLFEATPGKALLGLRVVDRLSGRPLGVVRATVRHLGYFVCAAPFLLGFLSIAAHPAARGWHDRLSGSIVLRRGRRDAAVPDSGRPRRSGLFGLLGRCGRGD